MSLALVLGFVGAIAPVADVSAVDVFSQCAKSGSSAVCKASGSDNLGSMVRIVINTILIVLGMIAVIMIVVGGIRYTTSNGDSSAIKSAKDTILYAVVGLVVAMLAFAIVNFVIDRFK
ncbi:MAG: rane protein of unknown function [Candidatus Saccharibacteria bacterium]|nr:rane protein of unknown function [Candidatus Saccharibacteria bacterium]